MCGRYWIEPEGDEELSRIIAQLQRLDPELPVKTEGEVFPGDGVPALCLSRAGNPRPFAMAWGYRLSGGRLAFNARSETASEKPLFRDGMLHRRCLLPMSAYFEWEKRPERKVKYRVFPRADEIHYLAGIYRFEDSGFPACTVLTTDAAPELSFIHPRMPVIVPSARAEAWLRAGELGPTPALDWAEA